MMDNKKGTITIYSKHTYPILDMDSKIPFGKFKGQLIGDIINKEPDYIIYLHNKGVYFSERVRNLAKVKNPKFRFRKVRKYEKS